MSSLGLQKKVVKELKDANAYIASGPSFEKVLDRLASYVKQQGGGMEALHEILSICRPGALPATPHRTALC